MECAVCLSEHTVDQTRILPCAHRICEACHVKWRAACQEAEVDFTCPCCRHVIQVYQPPAQTTLQSILDREYEEMQAAFDEEDGWLDLQDGGSDSEYDTDDTENTSIDYPDSDDLWESEEEEDP